MKKPYIDIIGHPDDGRYPVDYLALVQAAKEYKILLEVNNNSLDLAVHGREERKMSKLC